MTTKSTEFIEKFAELKSSITDSRHEPKEQSLARMSHLYLNGKRVHEIGDLSICAARLKVLYLQHNAIRRITNVAAMRQLTHLYLQNNRIERIDGLDDLPGLQKLYLGMNKIRVLENLDRLPSLAELHVERQRWAGRSGDDDEADGDGVQFAVDGGCIEALASHLKVLNVTGLRLTTLAPFTQLYRLEVLHAADNAFATPHQLGQHLATFARLHSADLRGCPAQRRDVRYKVAVLEAAHHLAELDGRLVSTSTSNFMRDLAVAKQRCGSTRGTPKDQQQQSHKSTESAHTIGPVIGLSSMDVQRAESVQSVQLS